MKKLSILAIALSILAVSCSKETGKGEPGGVSGAIKVTARVNNVTKAITEGAVTTFEYGDQLSLYAWTGDNTAVPADLWINGEVVTYDKETQLWEPKNLMLWKNLTDAHYFLGVYPARAIAKFTADPFEQNLDPAAKEEVNDLLVATVLGDGVKAAEKSVDLVFDHLMAKFNVSVRFRDQWGGIPEKVDVSIKGAATGTVDYISKTITPGNDVTKMPVVWRSTDLQDRVTYYCSYVIPQTGITEVVVNVEGSEYTYTNPADIPFVKGHVTTLPLIVGKDAIELADEGITIEGWNEGELPDGLGGDAVVAPKVTDLGSMKADYVASDKETLYGTLDANVKISIADGATVTLDGLTINGVNDANYKWAGITCVGDATIILKEGSVNSVMGFYETAPGIFIPEGKTLVIKGEGSLTACTYIKDPSDISSYGFGAGIGGGRDVSCGNIEIQGGNIVANGGVNAAGIGTGGIENENSTNCGTITISGGSVVATSKYFGAGIGCGYSGICDSITISGGTVEATGGYAGPGIGSTVGDSSCGDIIISGGTVTATTLNAAPGIGSSNEPSVCGNITISGGTVMAIGKLYSPGIGAGGDWFNGGSCGNITITSGVTKVTAIKGTEPEATNSIGAGLNAISCGTVTIGDILTGSIPTSPYMYPIDLSKVTADVVAGNGARIFETLAGNYKISIDDGATVILDNAAISYSSKGADWAGLTLIGDGTIQLADGTTNTAIGGLDNDGYSNCPGIFVPEGKTLTINGDTGVLIAACGDGDPDGQGAGIGASWFTNCGNIVINGGVISASGGNRGAGIGGSGRRNCGYITINGGIVTAIGHDGAPGIGIGGSQQSNYKDGGTCGNITITGGTVTATGGKWSAGIGTGSAFNSKDVTVTKTCGNILINGGTVTATGGEHAAGIGTGEAEDGKGIINIGTITITDGVTLLTATKGEGAPNSIGKGTGTNITCGTVTIGGVVGAITDSPYVYPLPYPINLSEVTSAHVGSVISANSAKVYKTVADAIADGEKPVAIIAYVGAAGSVEESDANFKGLAIALSDADGDMCTWADENDGLYYCCGGVDVDLDAALNLINGKTCTETLNNPYHTDHNHVAASFAKENKDTPRPDAASDWFLPSMGQWNLIVQGLATKKAGSAVTTDLTKSNNDTYKASNLNSVITAAGGEGFEEYDYWSSTEYDDVGAWVIKLGPGKAAKYAKASDSYVRSAFAF